MLKKVHVNISLVDLLTNIPKYTKFIKDMVSNKESLGDDEVMPLSTNYSCLIRKDLMIPEKMSDPGSCTIPYYIGATHFKKALCDLGSGVSLISLCLANFLGMSEEIKPIQITL